jgi:hypothetical protein
LSLRGPGLGPRLRFNPSGPWAFHALIQSCRSLREIPSLRATGRTPSPPSARLIAFSLYAVGNRRFFPIAATGHPRNEPVTEITVSHSRGAVQCTQLSSTNNEAADERYLKCTVTVIRYCCKSLFGVANENSWIH